MSLLSPQLQAFLLIAQYKTVHSAAAKLFITQTAATQRIRSLEATLHTTLFIRTRRGMELTSEGQALLRYCNAAKALEGEALANISGAGIQAEIQICIAGPTSIMQSRIIPACLPVSKNFPQMLMQFDVNDSEDRDKALRAGLCQMAIIQPEHVAPEMQSKILKPEQYVLVCSTKWKNRKLEDILQNERIIDYTPDDQLTFNYLKYFKLAKFTFRNRHYVNRTESLAKMIYEGYGFGVLTAEFSEPFLRKKQLMMLNGGKIYTNKLTLAWYDRPETPNYFQQLLDCIV